MYYCLYIDRWDLDISDDIDTQIYHQVEAEVDLYDIFSYDFAALSMKDSLHQSVAETHDRSQHILKSQQLLLSKPEQSPSQQSHRKTEVHRKEYIVSSS